MKQRIEVYVDRKAALLRGNVLDETTIIELGPEDCEAEVWQMIVNSLTITANLTPRLTNVWVTGNTAQDLIDSVKAKLAETNEKNAKRLAQEERAVALVRAHIPVLEAFLANVPLKPCKNWRFVESLTFHYDGVNTLNLDIPQRELAWIDPWAAWQNEGLQKEYNALIAREQELKAQIEAAAKAADDAAFVAARPEAERQLAEKKLADQAEELAKEQARQAKLAERLKSGLWEMETDSYNERRYGSYWVAAVDFDSKGKTIYDFNAGTSTAQWGKAGTLQIACKPGDVIAWGQKDHRKPSGSKHHMLRMNEDGSMTETDGPTEWKRIKA